MTGKEEINRDVDKFKASKRKEMAKKMKVTSEDSEPMKLHKMTNFSKEGVHFMGKGAFKNFHKK